MPAELDEAALARELDERGMPAELDEAVSARELDEATPHETKCRVGYDMPSFILRVVDTLQPDKQ